MQSADYLRGIDQRQQAFEMGLSTEALVEAFGGSIEPVRAQLERISVSAEQARVGEKMVDKREILELARLLPRSVERLLRWGCRIVKWPAHVEFQPRL